MTDRVQTCPMCHGEGRKLPNWRTCPECDGEGTVYASSNHGAISQHDLIAGVLSVGSQGDAIPNRVYEQCVTDSDGNCTRWSHDHSADATRNRICGAVGTEPGSECTYPAGHSGPHQAAHATPNRCAEYLRGFKDGYFEARRVAIKALDRGRDE